MTAATETIAETLRILLIDDNPDDRSLVSRELQREFPGVNIEQVSGEAGLQRALAAGAFDIVITDYQLLWSDGLQVLKAVRGLRPDVPVIMFTATGTEEIAVEAMKSGLDDYVIKRPWHFARLPSSVRRVLDFRQQKFERDEAERRHREMVFWAPVGIYSSTPDGDILDFNPALLRILGYPDRTSFEPLKIAALFADAAEHRRFVTEMEGAGAVQGMEVRMTRLDGTGIWTRMHARRHEDSLGRILHEGVVEDVTQRKDTEDALQKSEERLRLSQRLEAIGRLAGGVAHDFNNLLTVITGHAELLLTRQDIDQRLRKEVEEIKRAGERAAALTRQLLAFSRRQVLQPRVLSLNGIVADMLKMLHRLIGEDIKLETVLAGDLGSTRADPGQVEQVLMNLVVNARDAMPQGGTLILTTQNTDLDPVFARTHPPTEPGRYVMLAVEDSGIGMDRKTLAHIFEPFYTTKEVGKGTGLGLATVYGIVKQSGGYIWVYSEPDHGTVFKIYMPRVDAPAESLRKPRSTAPSTGTETVLLVEDEPTLREVVRDILLSRGYAVLAAADAREAERLCAAHPAVIQLLLTDVVMPGIGGRELARRLTAARPGIKVLYMSGYTDDAIVRHGILEAGVNFIQKPFAPEVLACKIREVLDPPPRS